MHKIMEEGVGKTQGSIRELDMQELKLVGGGTTKSRAALSGYQGAGAILTVLAVGAAISTAPISAPVAALAIGAAGGLATSETWARYF